MGGTAVPSRSRRDVGERVRWVVHDVFETLPRGTSCGVTCNLMLHENILDEIFNGSFIYAPHRPVSSQTG